MKLKVKRDYQNREHNYRAGETIEVSEELGAWLMRDSHSCFEIPKPPRRSLRKPPADKAIEEATEK